MCVDNAMSGDTINVTAGSATWVNSIPIRNKALTITGAGIDKTVITDDFFFLDGADDTQISGFTVLSMDGAENSHTDNGMSIRGTQRFRIHHNRIRCDAWNQVYIITDISKTIQSTGLLDHNQMQNCRYIMFGEFDGSFSSDDGGKMWAATDPIGTADSVFFEDNTAMTDNCDAASGNAGINCNWLDANSAGHYVARFNVVTNSYFEFHSLQGPRGGRMAEIYHNTLTCTGTFCAGFHRPFAMRGGIGVIFHNILTSQWSAGVTMDNVRSYFGIGHEFGDCNGLSFADGNTPGFSGWPCRDQIGRGQDTNEWTAAQIANATPGPAQSYRPWYAWKNSIAGMLNEISYDLLTGDNNGIHIVKDRDVFFSASTFDGTSGVGEGPSPPPSICTTNPSGLAGTAGWGPAYWATDQGEWNNKNGMTPDGQLYVCTAPNTWTMRYKPYPYPHPLQ